MKLKRYIHLALAAVGALTLVTSCDRPEYPEPTPSTEASTARSRVLFVNAAPGAPALNLLVNNVQVAQAVPFAGTQPGYAQVGVGNLQIRSKAANGTIGGTLGSNDLLFRAGATNNNNFTFAANANYTVFATDTLTRPRPTTPAGVTDPGGLSFLVLQDNLAAPAAGKAHIRFINLAPGTQAVELINVLTTQSLLPIAGTARNGRTGNSAPITNFQRRAYKEIQKSATIDNDRINVSITGFTPIDAGTYALQIQNSGSAAAGTKALPDAIPLGYVFESGKIYTIYLRGLVGGTGEQALGASVIVHN